MTITDPRAILVVETSECRVPNDEIVDRQLVQCTQSLVEHHMEEFALKVFLCGPRGVLVPQYHLVQESVWFVLILISFESE